MAVIDTAISEWTLQRLEELGAEQLHHLRLFARRRLGRFGLRSSEAADVVQAALLSVIEGACDPGHGRTPRLEDLTGPANFLNYLRGVVASKAEALSRRWEPECLELKQALRIPSSADPPDSRAVWNDIKREFFRRLRQRSPARLRSTVDAWESVFLESDRIPTVNGNRKHAHQVRLLARQVWCQMRSGRVKTPPNTKA